MVAAGYWTGAQSLHRLIRPGAPPKWNRRRMEGEAGCPGEDERRSSDLTEEQTPAVESRIAKRASQAEEDNAMGLRSRPAHWVVTAPIEL
jgi:hypothetical protein